MVNASDSGSDEYRAKVVSLLWVVVLAIVFAFCYFASSVCISLVLGAFLSVLVDPAVVWLERAHLPRALSAAVVILVGIALVALIGYLGYNKASQFIDDIPQYAAKIQYMTRPITEKIQRLQESANRVNQAPQITPPQTKKPLPVQVMTQPTWPSYLIRGISSVSGAILVGGVVPFLMFFLLLRKEHLYSWLYNTFGARMDVPQFVTRVSGMVRGFVVGNAIVGAISAVVMIGMLAGIGLHGAVTVGIAAGIVNPIPYLGAVFAMAIPLLVGTLQFTGAGPFLIIIVTALVLHLIANNLLVPKLVGSRVNVDPVAATLGILFWGWLWGVVGVLLAVPLTAFVKLVADTRPSLLPLSNLLAERPRPVPPWARFGQFTPWRSIPFLSERFRHKPRT